MNLQNSFVAGQMISKSEMLAAGLPIGNPHAMQAPFNKRYEMPFAPLVGAFTAIGAATTIGTTALAVVNFAAVAAMYAGVAMTVTGLVTGDKELMKLGGLVGLAGGVGSLAAGGIASLAAGAEFTMGTAGIEAANAATAASANTANLAAGAATATTISQATGQAAQNAATATANMSPVTGTLGTTANQAVNNLVSNGAKLGGGLIQQSPLIRSEEHTSELQSH